MAIDHISIGVSDMARAKTFYDAVLAPLGFAPVAPIDVNGMLVAVGYGEADGKPVFWAGYAINMQMASAGNGVHVAFTAPSRAAVDAAYHAGLAHGGRDDGAPGLRPQYHPDYYAAFILDPDGNKIEAVRHQPD